MFCVNRTVWAGGLAMVVGVALFLSAGCRGGAEYEGPERAAVSGKVTLDGNPLPYGSITFVSGGTAGRRASALIRNGEYSIPEERGPHLGKCQVQIAGHEKAPPPPGAAVGGEGEDENDRRELEDDEMDLGPQILPAKYNKDTTLEVDITSGENTCNFPLTSD